MIRGTTPTFTMKIKDQYNVDLNEATNVYFTVAQGANKITKTGDDIEISGERTALIFLDQEESLSLKENQSAKVQLNWTYPGVDGKPRRAATKVKEITIEEQLIKKVIE